LDRYGELYTTVSNVRSGIEKSPNVKLVLNADDSLCASLGHNMDREAIYYGFSEEAYNNSSTVVNSDASICLYCKSKYEYSYNVYGHLGGFSCPNCGYMRPDSKVTCVKINELNTSYSDIIFSLSPIKGMTSRFHTTPELIFPDFITYITHWLRRPWDIFQAFRRKAL